MSLFAARLRSASDKEMSRLATEVEQLCAAPDSIPSSAPATQHLAQPAPTPVPAGSANILQALKRRLRLQTSDAEPVITVLNPDRFPLAADSPLKQEHEWLNDLFDEIVGTHHYMSAPLPQFRAGQALLAKDPLTAGRVVLAAAERHIQTLITPSADYTDPRFWQARAGAAAIASQLMRTPFEADRDELFDLLLYLAVIPDHTRAAVAAATEALIAKAEREAAHAPLTEGERYVLSLVRVSLLSGPALGMPGEMVARLSRMINDGASFYLAAGEAWSDAVNAELTCLDAATARHWASLLKQALGATSARPSAKWLATGRKLVDAIGGDSVQQSLARWLPLVAEGRTIHGSATMRETSGARLT